MKSQFTNFSRRNMFVPLPSIVFSWNDYSYKFSISAGWLFFAFEWEVK